MIAALGAGVSARLALATLAVLALVACGRKGPPVAPEQRLPQPVSELTGVARDGAIVLSWVVPRRRVDETRLPDAATARVYRAEDTGAGEPKPALLARDRIAGYTEVAVIPLTDSPFVQGGRVVYPDRRDLTFGRRYTYVVVTTDAAGRTSPPSRRLSVTFGAAPEPPTDVRAEPGEREARLSWRPPARLTDGTAVGEPLVYEILRAPMPDAPLAPVARTPPGATSAVDRPLENERTYAYAVRAVRDAVEGAPSSRVTVTPADMTPPSPPADLVAVPSQGTVRLSWSPSPEPDVAGYVVYRGGARGTLTRVGATRAPGTTFTDRDVPRGTYRYAVSAHDAAARPNESARSGEVTVTVP